MDDCIVWMTRRLHLCSRNKAIIVLARNRQSFRVKDVCALPEFEGVKAVHAREYLRRLLSRDVLRFWKVGGAAFWALSERYEEHVPGIYR